MDLNLDTLKQEIVDYLEANSLAIFRNSPGTLEGSPMILWDSEHYPDYRMFVDAAIKASVKLILFANREFEASDIDELVDQLEDIDLERDQVRDYQARLRKLRIYEGVTCSLELAFNHDSHLYVYELQPDWYEEFLIIEDEIANAVAGEDVDDEGDSLGGYFSKN